MNLKILLIGFTFAIVSIDYFTGGAASAHIASSFNTSAFYNDLSCLIGYLFSTNTWFLGDIPIPLPSMWDAIVVAPLALGIIILLELKRTEALMLKDYLITIFITWLTFKIFMLYMVYTSVPGCAELLKAKKNLGLLTDAFFIIGLISVGAFLIFAFRFKSKRKR